MAQDAGELRVARNGDLYVAPVGTAFPADPGASPSANWIQLGLVSQDGVSFNRAITIEEFPVWQRRMPARREISGEDVTLTAALAQWNATNFEFAFGGGQVVEDSPGIYRYDFPSGEEDLDERALMLRWRDKGNSYQLGFDRGSVVEPVETSLNRTSLALLPISFKALAPEGEDLIGVSFLTDDPAFEPIGS